MKEFKYEGVIPSSKSNYNRALIIQSFNPKIAVIGQAQCDDIIKMKAGVSGIARGETHFDCGEAGTVLRFLALRISREKGSFLLTGKPRLFRRPQHELLHIFSQLQVKAQLEEKGMRIESRGWITEQPIKVSASDSSQFLSGIMLSVWNLEQDLHLEISQNRVSESYFKLTLEILKEFGLKWIQDDRRIRVPAGQVPKLLTYKVESDLSSAFVIAALAAAAGSAHIKEFPFESRQPDLAFIEIMKKMGIELSRVGNDLIVTKANSFKPIEVNLKESPDLFPVLSALASRAHGQSHFYGAHHLKFKESDRIAEVVKVLFPLGVEVEPKDDGAFIQGIGKFRSDEVILDAKEDHRLVMMGTVLKALGFSLKIKNADSVRKSFPEFLDIARDYL
jgi:3-phosphoshikimate 1-carboxyvinyltransferase